MRKKQVDKAHYNFEKYVNKRRWISIWHQLKEVISLNPASVLEIGVGSGIFKTLMGHYGITVDTVDIDPDLHPDYLAEADGLPFSDNAYDCVCAFQVLEHMPYHESLRAFSEMVRVSNKYIVMSLPDAKTMCRYSLQLPEIGPLDILIPIPRIFRRDNSPWHEHFWEINIGHQTLQKIIDDLSARGAEMVHTYRVKEKPYWRFFVFKKHRGSPCRHEDATKTA